MQPIIYPLFSTPVYHVPDTKFRVDNALLTRFLDRTEFPNFRPTCGLTENMFILDNPEFKSIRRVCEFHLQEYVTAVLGIETEFYITNSWLSRNEPNIDHGPHPHPNSIISGCLYLKSSPKSELIVTSKNHLDKTWPIQFRKTHINIYNADKWNISVDTGAIVLWPSDLFHGSNANPLNETRIALCFNTFIRGDLSTVDLGGYSTNLILK